MLLALDSTTKSIMALGSNPNAASVSFVAVYADSSGTAFTEGVSDGALQASTYVTLVAAPAAGTRRIIKSITFYNNHSSAIGVSLDFDNNGTKRRIVQLLIGVGQTWSSDDLGSAGTFKLVNNSTPIEGGTNGSVLYNVNGIVSEIARTGTSTLVSSVSPTIATPTIITPSVQQSITSTTIGFDLINTTATTVNFAGAATTLNIGGAASAITSLSAGSGSVVNLGGGANAAELRFLEPSGSGTNYTALKAQAQAANVTYTLPAADGSNGQVLATNGSGLLSWAAGGTGGGGGGGYKNIVINGAMSLTSYKTAEGFIVPTAITSTTTSINVGTNEGAATNHAGSLAPFPASGIVLVNSELIQYSAKTGETGAAFLTVASGGRGYDGTTAASASIGATIALAPYQLGITTSGYYTADRWRTHINNSVGTWEQAVVNDAPSNTMFRRSLRMKCTTANAAVDAADILRVEQLFEGQNVQHIRKGTSDAQQLTCSFFVKSSVTGTYIVELVDNNNLRRVSASYSITTANTWQEVSVTFPADTTGVLTNDNAYSLGLCFWLVAGSTYASGGSLQTSWGTATNTRAVGQINLSANAGQSWQITGVQLELGASKTPFEYLHITDVAALCARYYRFFPNAGVDDTCIGAGAGYTDRGVSYNMLITPAMRTGPTVAQPLADIALRSNTLSDTYQIALGGSTRLPFRTTGTYIILQALSNGMVRDTIDRVFLYRPLSLDAELAGGN